MALRTIFKSLTDIKSLGVLSAVLIGYFVFKWEPLIIIGLLGYLAASSILLINPNYRQKCFEEDKINKLRKMNNKSTSLYFRVKAKVGKSLTTKIIERIFVILGKTTFVDLESRVDEMFKTKAEIANAFFNKEYSSIREKIALKSLELSIIYFKLMEIYVSRLFDVSNRNLTAIEERISINRRKKITAINQASIYDLDRAIEADEKLLGVLKEARKEVGKMSAKLNLIESTMALLKQQIYTEFHTDDIFENVENTINEAQALESALSQHSTMKKKNQA
ncbi:MAG: hypothetical protein ACM3UU_05495 [Ignavibacteriales bacterium]